MSLNLQWGAFVVCLLVRRGLPENDHLTTGWEGIAEATVIFSTSDGGDVCMVCDYYQLKFAEVDDFFQLFIFIRRTDYPSRIEWTGE